MDNVTHSVAGLLLAESMARLRARGTNKEPSARFGAIAAMSSVVAAKLPDADLFYSGLGGDRLRYMLHHRGYTHTLVVAIVGAFVVWGVVTLLSWWRGRVWPAREDAGWLLLLLLAGALSYLAIVSPAAAVAVTAGALLSVGLARMLRADGRVVAAMAAWMAVTLTGARNPGARELSSTRRHALHPGALWRTLGDSTVLLGDVRYSGGGSGLPTCGCPAGRRRVVTRCRRGRLPALTCWGFDNTLLFGRTR